MLGIGEKCERQLVLRLELLVRCDVVGTDAEHLGAALAEDVIRVAELAGLRRTTRRVVLGIEVENNGLSPKLAQLDALTGVAGELEVGGEGTFCDHARSFSVGAVNRRQA